MEALQPPFFEQVVLSSWWGASSTSRPKASSAVPIPESVTTLTTLTSDRGSGLSPLRQREAPD